jgi:hypothetical protein
MIDVSLGRELLAQHEFCPMKILMAKRLVSVQGTCRDFVEVLKPLLYERCQGETHRKSPKISPTFLSI